MKRAAVVLALAAVVYGIQVGSGIPEYKNAGLPVDRRVADLLKRMTLEEKAAQTQALWQKKSLIMDAQLNFSPEKARGVLKHGLGQITRAGEKRTARETAIFTNAVQKWVLENTRLAIPVMFHEEGLHGNQAPGSTNFPVPIAMASSWNPALLDRVYSAVAREIRARGAQHVLAPVLDLARDPRWGRVEETFGEDPYLVSRMGVATIMAFQGGRGPAVDRDHIFATTKHCAVPGQPENGTNAGPGNSSERVVRDQFLYPFEAGIREAGAMSVMPSYNEIDGVPSHANKWLLQQVLRREWGFEGFVVSDYQGIDELETLHHVVANPQDAARTALETGVDLELPDMSAYGTLVSQVREGRITEAPLARAVARILRAKFLSGLFENPYTDVALAEKVVNSPAHRALAAEAARQSIVLLKNEGVLPLDRAKIRSVAIIGPNAAKAHLGGYSDDPGHTVSILEGVQHKVGGSVQVTYAEGCRITRGEADWFGDKVEPPDPALDAKLIPEAVEAAKAADVALVVIGQNESISREAWSKTHMGDREDLNLVGRQEDLVKAVMATGTPVVVFLINGSPVAVNWIAQNVPALLEGWYLGEETGTAVADVLFGDYNPAGRLPITIPRSVGQLPVFYNYKPSARRGYVFGTTEPLYAFGYGLSYTKFGYANLRIEPAKMPVNGKAVASVDVTNIGGREGDEVVQMYIHDLVSSVTRPVKELRGFERIHLRPGETKTARFEITPDKLAFTGLDMKRIVEPGDFDILIGPSTARLKVE